ncbi:MAG: hypothetical protein J6Y99_02820 [Bacteroidales bacterium]|nr:hypothetical protein [Bacteroidales bacterium]
MKHLLIFLNYNCSRLDNPVYCKFSIKPSDRREVAMIFSPRTIEEREILHEVGNLRKKEGKTLSDVTFHLFVELEQANDSQSLLQTVCLIKRLFRADDTHRYPCIAYGHYADLTSCSHNQVTTIWNNLANISNGIAQYRDFSLIDHVYLYQDATMLRLADFLYEYVQADIYLPPTPRNDEEGYLYPPIFSAFNTQGITYPEGEVYQYVSNLFVHQVLRQGLAQENPTDIEICNNEAKRILTSIPLQNSILCLQEEQFLQADPDHPTNWEPVSRYWDSYADKQISDLKDYPHSEWLKQLSQKLEVAYHSRFRNVGVEYFFQQQECKTNIYISILSNTIRLGLGNALKKHPYTPEAQKCILHAITNVLQQKVLEIKTFEQELNQQILQLESQTESIAEKWNRLKLFSRMLKKDRGVLEEYKQRVSHLFALRTYIQGCYFATKLLNELIPAVATLQDAIDESHRVLDEAIDLSGSVLIDTRPDEALVPFGTQQLEQATEKIRHDREALFALYQPIALYLYNSQSLNHGEELLSFFRNNLLTAFAQYMHSHIETGDIPPVLFQKITDRLHALYADKGGFPAFLESMKTDTSLKLKLKAKNQVADNYTLITPAEMSDCAMRQIVTDDVSHIQLLHTQHGIRLTYLSGFSGQRLFIEPTIF